MLQAFHNDTKIKAKYVKRVKAHYKADEIIQGVYWEKGKGCAVGCTIENDGGTANWHRRYEDQLGVPRILARLEDKIFEELANGEAKEFPLKFLQAINVGADLSLVFYQFMHWLLIDPKDGVIQYAKPDSKKAIQKLADLFERKINGEDISSEVWWSARSDAAAAAADADADAAAYAAYAAYAAAYAYAADADAAAYAAAAARSKHYKKMADKLIELLKAAK